MESRVYNMKYKLQNLILVLILVLMESRVYEALQEWNEENGVLILVLMESRVYHVLTHTLLGGVLS